jgi:hypothetical protein
MGNLITLPNISLDSVVNEDEEPKPKKEGFDVKNYLNVRLAEGETQKTLTIRLLPMDLETGNPFAKIHVHNVKVPQEMVEPGKKPYKTYICLKNSEGIDHEKFGTKCPFCEMNYAAYLESTKETDPVKKKALQDASLAFKSQEAVIVRCIERGKENEGVKFWKFNIRAKDKLDPYNQILNLAKMREEAAKKKGEVNNILDIYDGRDLNITITSVEKSAPTIIDDSDRSPLSKDEEQMKKWIFDTKKWQEVFTCKPYEYLNLVSQMRIPWFDKQKGVWVAKEDYEKEHGANTTAINNEIKDAESQIKENEKNNSFASSLEISDDDLPR